ncbi:uncharacterized protein LOC106645658 [Copidosoma floridanum]|uniref:uncharacterized protein LOC106645658 n=1 Tax=Copidosoma floridanum TaxID=29053 RepID=UPI0006C97FB8|nr:uncharacterized protein LOC106645658 [Copidosoma floridanum]
MPRGRRANIGRRTRHASQQQVHSQNLSEERQNIIRENARLRQRFKRETAGLCCASGKVKLDPLLTPPQPLKPSFGGTNIIREGGFMPTCKVKDATHITNHSHQHKELQHIQGQIYHLHGSMVPTPDEPHQFLQIYFISLMVDQLNVRCNIQGTQQLKRRIIEQLQAFFHASNAVVNTFKTALERMPPYTHKFVIRADCTPTGVSTNKNLSAMNYYAYHMMIRTHEENVILKFRRLFQQFTVNMYFKVETERLAFIRFNQAKLRSEDYIHLRDAIHSQGDVQNIGRLTILSSSYIRSPRHMHEYAQDAMTYVRTYGTPDLFITFTCNPKWTEIERQLEPGQKPQNRHDIIARVFQQKLKVMMDVLTKYQVFGDTRCYMYSVEWQKRGLPHAHILIWLLNKLHSNEVDDIISAEIPDPVTDPHLHGIVTTQMVHGPCCALNPLSPCMSDKKCTKRYPRSLVAETVTGNDGYPVYRRRSKEDNGRTIKVKVQNQEIEIGNKFIVPYYPLLSRIFETHANVESCHSAKSIKYLCKYVTKGSGMAVFGISSENANDEISNFQMGRYVITHLAVHLENGQRVYFTEANAAQRAERPPSTTLTSFFAMCEADPFAVTLMYVEMPKY